MRYHKTLVLGISLLLIVSSVGLVMVSGGNKKVDDEVRNQIPDPKPGYTSHAPIRIDNNAELAVEASSGTGTEGDPYVIEGWEIDGTGYGYCLYVGNTTDYFTVKDNYLHNSSGKMMLDYFRDTGIYLFNVKNGTLENNSATNNEIGIYLKYASNITVSNNTASNNSNNGLEIERSDRNTIKVDGINDFQDVDRVANDISESGKAYWDLTDLYATRDNDNWYFGFTTNTPTSGRPANLSTALFIDSDVGNTGGLYSPRNKLANLNTSHKETVGGVAYNPNGSMIASCSRDNTVKVWNTTTGLSSHSFSDNSLYNPTSLEWTDDGRYLLSVDYGDIFVWDVKEGVLVEKISYYTTQVIPIDDPYISLIDSHKNTTGAHEEWLAVAGGKMFHIYNVSDSNPSNWTLFGSVNIGYIIHSIRVSPDGNRFATGLDNRNVNIYNWTAINKSDPENITSYATYETKFEGHSGDVYSISWNRNGDKIVSGSKDSTVRIWDLPVTEKSNIANATSLITTGDFIDESDDNISDMQNNHPINKSPTFSEDGDGWYTLESNENLSLSAFDIGDNGGAITELYIDIRYDVNDTDGNMNDWDLRYMQFQRPSGGWSVLGCNPSPGDNNVTYSEELSTYFNYVRQIPDIVVRYDFDYTGPTPGPSVSFDYIKINYTYVEGGTYANHSTPITQVGWSPDGDTIISTEEGSTSLTGVTPEIHCWNSADTRMIANKSLRQPIYSIDLENNTHSIVTGSRDLSVREMSIINNDFKEIEVYRQNKVNHALFVNFTSFYEKSIDDFVFTEEESVFYTYLNDSWDGEPLIEIGGHCSGGYNTEFIEFAIPRSEIPGDPSSLHVQLVSFGRGYNNDTLDNNYVAGEEGTDTSISHAQDSVPSDPNVFERAYTYGMEPSPIPYLDFSKVNITSLGRFTSFEIFKDLKKDGKYGNTIENNTFSNNKNGIYISSSIKNHLKNNKAYSNNYGAVVYKSDDNTFIDNNFSSNSYGIHLNYSTCNSLLNNTIYNNSADGIYTYRSNTNSINHNTINSNREDGIELKNSFTNTISRNKIMANSYGVYFESSSNNTFHNNNVSNSINYGLIIYSSNNNTFKKNNISNNEYGLLFSFYTDNNRVYHNRFINNTNQGYDYENNHWDNGYPSGGNYWNDYNSPDNYSGVNQDEPGGDGIGDSPYAIDGDTIDNYPLIFSPWLDTYAIDLYSYSESDGWQFVSIPIETSNQSIQYVLSYIEGSYDKVMYYDSADGDWKTYVVGRAEHYNSFRKIVPEFGFWIHMSSDATLVVDGQKPVSTDITLQPGWNMVGYPSEINQIASYILPSEVTKIGIFNKYAPYNIEYIDDLSTEVLVTGRGYWIYNDADYTVVWTVDY